MAKTDQSNKLILIKGGKDEVLTKNQRSFNRLSKRIADLQSKIEKDKVHFEFVLSQYAKLIQPLQEKMAQFKMEMAFILDKGAEKFRLGKRQQEEVQEAILFLLDQSFGAIDPDEEAEALYDKWSDTSYQEEVDAGIADMKEMMADKFRQTFGMEVDFSELDFSDEGFAQFESQLKDQFDTMGQHAFSANQPKPRKKSKRQLEREQREQEAEKLQQKSIRSVYLSLAKALHPDTASSEDERLEKEALIKLVTAAYQKKDLPALLSLEAEWVASARGKLGEIGEDKLTLYLSVMKNQVAELEEAQFALRMNPRYEKIQGYCFLPEKQLTKQIKGDHQQLKSMQELMKEDCRALSKLSSKKELMDFIRQLNDMINDLYDWEEEDEDEDWRY